MLRDYQKRALSELYEWFRAGNKGNPCLILPTGSGKSHVIAELCKGAIQNWAGTKILMLSHVKEIIEQNAEKMQAVWNDAPLGIYSAGIGRKETGFPITFASIQSVYKHAEKLGFIDLVIVDEAHRISHKKEGGYIRLIDDLTKINPALRVVGLTATPWRLGHGKISEDGALFSDLLEPVSILELVERGFLCPLRSKHTDHQLSVDGVHKRGGEFIEKELQEAVNTHDNNQIAVAEIVRRGEGRKSWLIFCTGVEHSENIRDEIKKHGITCESVTGNMDKKDREATLAAFKNGEIQAITNCNVLTTGFDHTGIDLLAMLRPTMSPTLYVQMAGRGMRIREGKTDCLVLDFAGNIMRHGAIIDINSPVKEKEGNGEAPVKVCPVCQEVVGISTKICPACFTRFEIEQDSEPGKLSTKIDIMGGSVDMEITKWMWNVHTSRKSGRDMLKCRYYGDLSSPAITEYVTVLHDGYAGKKAMQTISNIAKNCNINLLQVSNSLSELVENLNAAPPPAVIQYRQEGKFFQVLQRKWHG